MVEPWSPLALSLEEHATSVLLSASAPAMAKATVVREYFIIRSLLGGVVRRVGVEGRAGGGRPTWTAPHECAA
nr:hypothetical protein GCM10020063_100610 [Dactylosporangium thailandense]